MIRQTIALLILSTVIAFVSCQEKKPVYMLSDAKFQACLMDVALAREAVRSAPYLSQDSLMDLYLDAIAQRYELTATTLQEELDHRLADVQDLNAVYDSVLVVVDSLIEVDGKIK